MLAKQVFFIQVYARDPGLESPAVVVVLKAVAGTAAAVVAAEASLAQLPRHGPWRIVLAVVATVPPQGFPKMDCVYD